MSDPTQHQDYQVFPQLGTPLVDPDQRVTQGWYRLFVGFWTRLGGNFSRQSEACFVTSPTSGGVFVKLCSTGEQLGELQLVDQSALDSAFWFSQAMGAVSSPWSKNI